jgi:hypothetical protein
MTRPIDILGQFHKLCPSYSRCLDLTPAQIRKIVAHSLVGERRRGKTRHWSYDINRHQALAELYDAIKQQSTS